MKTVKQPKTEPTKATVEAALLAACKAALHRLETDGYQPNHHGGEVLTQLRAAIKQVEGE